MNLGGAIRMKGGVAFDPQVNAFRVIVHSWDNPDCLGESEEWQSEETFQSEDSAMSFYKMEIRPGLDRLMKEIGSNNGVTASTRRLEE